MHAYYDVLKRKADISNLYYEKDFEWADDEVLDDVLIPGTVSKWNELVEVSTVMTCFACCSSKMPVEWPSLAAAPFFFNFVSRVLKPIKNAFRRNFNLVDYMTSLSFLKFRVFKTLLIR
jgi:hypothetical protein